MDNDKIKLVKQMNYLGSVFDYKLTWKSHRQCICAKLSNDSWALLKLRYYVDTNMQKTVYYSLIYSHIQYCSTPWGVASATALEPLEKMHKRVMRKIPNSPIRSHTTSIFKELNLLKANDVFKLKFAKKMHKYKNNPQVHSIQITPDIEKTHKYNTRHSFNQTYFLPKKEHKWAKSHFQLLDLNFGK